MGGSQQPSQYPARIPRRYPRVALVTPVEIQSEGGVYMGSSEEVSAGGLRVDCAAPLKVGQDLWVRFNLTTGPSLHARAIVVGSYGEQKFGLKFVGLEDPQREALLTYCRKLLGYSRRGERLPRRLHVTIWRAGEERKAAEQLAETVLVSRHGGLLVCRVYFREDETVFICWPKEQRIAQARVVQRKASGTGGLMEVAFEFLEEDNFWGMEFGNESGKWNFES
jgi:hypothetical protein